MLTMTRSSSMLLVIDLQARLMPAIDRGDEVVANARRLIDAAALLDIPQLFTEQNAKGLGATVPGLIRAPDLLVHKMTFDACREPGFLERLPRDRGLVVAGCEAHVCVLQTVLGLLAKGLKIYAVQDAIGARRSESKEAALARMAHHGAEIVTTEMVVFEWTATAEHPRFKELLNLVK